MAYLGGFFFCIFLKKEAKRKTPKNIKTQASKPININLITLQSIDLAL